MIPFLFRLTVAIYALSFFPALIFSTAGAGAVVTAALIFGTAINVPILLIAWVVGGLRQRP